MMGDIKFLDTLKAYDKDNIPKHIMKTIREKYVNNPYFDPNLVKKVQFYQLIIYVIITLEKIMTIRFYILLRYPQLVKVSANGSEQ